MEQPRAHPSTVSGPPRGARRPIIVVRATMCDLPRDRHDRGIDRVQRRRLR
jgi:hypothetical protein